LLRRVTDVVVECRPDIIVGDFNAPRRSRALCPLPEGFSHAYDDAGCGWSYTWPVPCPVLAIDQCITGSRVKALKYDLGVSRHSDHRMQILDFATKDN
jgi:endonuclease/exonuclease/phosphatase family metal-dependent hydrolase